MGFLVLLGQVAQGFVTRTPKTVPSHGDHEGNNDKPVRVTRPRIRITVEGSGRFSGFFLANRRRQVKQLS